MTTSPSLRGASLFAREHAILVLGLGALLVGAGRSGAPSLVAAGIAALFLTGLRVFATAHGIPWPPAGHLGIVTRGCWETPLAFAVRRGPRRLLFQRTPDPATGALPEEYSVYLMPPETPLDRLRFFGLEPPTESRLLGEVPTAALRFDHRRGSSVAKGELDAALAALDPRRTAPLVRPRGVKIIGILNFVSAASYVPLFGLALLRPSTLGAVLRGLAAEGSGPHPLERLGSYLPLYFGAMAVAMWLLARSWWRLQNWTRLVMLGISVVSLVGSLAALAGAASAGSLSGSALSLSRIGLCWALLYYLLRPDIRACFARPTHRES